MKQAAALLMALMLMGGTALADEMVVCNGDIFSTQGEGMVSKQHRFEVWNISGADVQEVLEKCRKIAAERQAKVYRKDASLFFRKNAEVNLECKKGGEKFQVKRMISVK